MSSEDQTQQFPGGADTKPTLESVVYRLDRLGALIVEQFKEINERLDSMTGELQEFRDETRRSFSVLNDDLFKVKGEQRRLDQRMTKLEAPPQ